ncbi:MAG: GAF domain-containing protein [Candidatus Atribacteria bacterium]|nr:MAG: GAF domain-containing protein [Candidatus Atribacteria bacterium]
MSKLLNNLFIYETLGDQRQRYPIILTKAISVMAEFDKNAAEKLEKENISLRAAVEELSILNEISTAINSTMSLDQVIRLVVQKCIKHLGSEQGTITLLNKGAEENSFQTIVRQADKTHDFLPFHLDTQLTGWMIINQKPILSNDLENDDRFKTLTNEANPIRALLSVPLLSKGIIIGSLNVFNKRDDKVFTDEDKRLLSIIATQSAQVIENARLHEEEKVLAHIREEMKTAFKIQTGLLPKEIPVLNGYELAGKSIPAKDVGGDYFDFIKLDDGRIAACLGDVSGKGMPAALLMSNLQATFRGQDLANHPPRELMSRSNELLFRSTDPDKFATFFFGILDTEKHEFHYCNAGHNYPFHIKENNCSKRLELGGLLLGALEGSKYSDGIVKLEPGNLLLIFSDGISEARNPAEAELGEEILPDLILKHTHETAMEIIDHIMDAADRFAEGSSQMDDMTIVIIRRLE